jgi:hypothetical protein
VAPSPPLIIGWETFSRRKHIKESHTHAFFLNWLYHQFSPCLHIKSKPLSAKQREESVREVKTVDILIVLFEGVDREKGRVVGRAGF